MKWEVVNHNLAGLCHTGCIISSKLQEENKKEEKNVMVHD